MKRVIGGTLPANAGAANAETMLKHEEDGYVRAVFRPGA